MNASTSLRRFGWSAVACLALVGCETATPPPPSPSAPTPEPAATAPADKDKNVITPMPVDPAKPETKGASSDAATKFSDKELAEIRKLPADEQPIALAQMTCPVSGKNLGMDVPIKQTIGTKTFYICCSGCEDMVKDEPAAVLAKLKK